MRFEELEIPGAYLIETEPVRDERGAFARTFCAETFMAFGLDPRVAQCGLSRNRRAGTLRGMHWQDRPAAECKLVRCGRGAIYDVLVDVRPSSPAFTRWIAVELHEDDGRLLYAPEGIAHGFQTLADDTEVAYQLSAGYAPELVRGARYDDPAFGIDWPPAEHLVLSDRDRSFPPFHS